ncbi:MAG: SCO family protein [Candidatus Methylomirabilis oxyfera]|nr:SCO family protein [Candidatus Methylomirabilis oxyfera]
MTCVREMTADERRRRRRFPNVVLRTHENKAVRFYDDLVKDKFVLINFMYTGCLDDCPLTTAHLVLVQKLLRARLGRDLFIYSITVDPAHDTPQVLRAYARRFRVGPGWRFLTGTPMAIAELRRALGDNPRLEPGESDHLGVIRYGIEALERWEGCPALTPPESIARYITWLEPQK